MKATLTFDLDVPSEYLSFLMADKAISIYQAINRFDNAEEVSQVAKDYLFQFFDDQKDGLVDLVYSDILPTKGSSTFSQ